MTQHTFREKSLPQLPSALGAPEMHQTHQKLIKRQGNNSKPERKYQELLPGTPVWIQHRQNATCEPAIVVNQCAPNSYWMMQNHWQIQGGAASAHPPPTGSISFVFAYIFARKCTHRRLVSPQWEILDPPLRTT